jgi:hypothetical protein
MDPGLRRDDNALSGTPIPDLRCAASGMTYNGQGHRTVGGMEERIDAMLPPVLRPKIVPRS